MGVSYGISPLNTVAMTTLKKELYYRFSSLSFWASANSNTGVVFWEYFAPYQEGRGARTVSGSFFKQRLSIFQVGFCRLFRWG